MDDADDADLGGLLAADDPVSVTAFPDGSVDRFFAVESGGEREVGATGGRREAPPNARAGGAREQGSETSDTRAGREPTREGRVADRSAFAARVPTDGPTEFDIQRRDTFPGGHAVNLAEQTAALGDDATVYGHLDHPVFGGLDANRVSMGDPAEVSVLEFDDGDVLLVEDSADISSWTLADLRAAAPDFDAAVTADAVCCVNWASFPAMTDALADLAAADPHGRWFLFDPGSLTDESADAVRRLGDALGALDDPYRVAVSVNRAELHDLARALDCDRGDDATAVAAVRDALGVTGVVLHARDAAIAGTPERRVSVPNPSVETPTHRTGAGDRFDAGLAHGLAAGWEWSAALALGNHCGAHYVETGETVDRDALAERLDRVGDATEPGC